jgi:hypothetical protein
MEFLLFVAGPLALLLLGLFGFFVAVLLIEDFFLPRH